MTTIFVHGVNCEKAEHRASSGYLHPEDCDGPYDVDGVFYCGRCHHALPSPTNLKIPRQPDSLPEMKLREWLKDQCNRHLTGRCDLTKCLVRGGYTRGDTRAESFIDYSKATCHAHEILVRLDKLEALENAANCVHKFVTHLCHGDPAEPPERISICEHCQFERFA